MNIENVWFTSDQHFGHENIIKYAERPFDNIKQMDKVLVNEWNNVIGDEDIVYHLGDLSLGNEYEEYFSILNGKRIYILSNSWHHDKRWMENYYSNNVLYSNINIIDPIEVLEYSELSKTEYPQVIVLCHYPFAEWDRKHYGSWHLHGHSHAKYQTEGKILDVGVDNIHKLFGSYRPINLYEVKEIMDEK